MANKPGSENENISEVLIDIELTDLNNFKDFETHEIFLQGNPWCLAFRERSLFGNDFLVAFLCSKFNYVSEKAIIANSEIKIFSLIPNTEAYCIRTDPSVFSSRIKSARFCPYISWNRLMDPENGFVMDEKCNLQIKIKATPLIDDATDDLFKIETIDSCDNCLLRKFRMKINKFHNFFAISSPEIVFKDFSFRVMEYRCVNEFCFRIFKYGLDGCSVSFIFKLKSYDTNIEPMRIDVKNIQFRPGETASEVYRLATWEQLTDPAKKFIENNSFAIEVDLKVKTDEPNAKKCPKCSAVFLECPICFENLKSVSISTITTCGHMFCTQCATEALRKNGKCPLCHAVAPLKSLIRSYLPTV